MHEVVVESTHTNRDTKRRMVAPGLRQSEIAMISRWTGCSDYRFLDVASGADGSRLGASSLSQATPAEVHETRFGGR